jgi:hypothetical protein
MILSGLLSLDGEDMMKRPTTGVDYRAKDEGIVDSKASGIL